MQSNKPAHASPPGNNPPPQQPEAMPAVTPAFQQVRPPIDKVEIRKILKAWRDQKFAVAQAQPARSSTPTATLSSLPMELLYLISSMGKSAVLSNRLGSISRDFTYLREHMRTGPLEIGENELTEFFAALEGRTRNFGNLDSLVLRCNQGISPAQLQSLPKPLNELSLVGLDAASLPSVLAIGDHIKRLVLADSGFSINVGTREAAELIRIFQIPSLRELHINERLVNPVVLAQCLETSTVEHLELRAFSDIPIPTFLRNNIHIKTLDLSDSVIHPGQLIDIQHISRLAELKLQNCRLKSDHMIDLISAGPIQNLEWLDVRGNPRVNAFYLRMPCEESTRLSAIGDHAAYVRVFGSKLKLMNDALSAPPPGLGTVYVDLSGGAAGMHDLRKFPVVLPDSTATLVILGGSVSFLPSDFLHNSAVTHFGFAFARIDAEAYGPLLRSNVLDLTFLRCELQNNDLQAMAINSRTSTVEGRFLTVSENLQLTNDGVNIALRIDPRLSVRHGNFLTLQEGGLRRLASGELLHHAEGVSHLSLVYRAGPHMFLARIPQSTIHLNISYQDNADNWGRANRRPGFALDAEDIEMLTFRPDEGSNLTTISLSNVALDADAFAALADRTGAATLILNACHIAYDELLELNPITRVLPHFLRGVIADDDTVTTDGFLALSQTFPTLSIQTPTQAKMTGPEVVHFFEALQATPEIYAQLQRLALDLDPDFALSGAWLARLPQSITEIEFSGGRIVDLQAEHIVDMQWRSVALNGTRINDDHLALFYALPTLNLST
ncbi:leucine-rich repeat domain-containing protein [Achromobacter marplatensis]|uniref:hypothetical protein n=1 Tax=Achromobacter marplatensis TaxID=470868 RepID=UPI0039F6DDE6